ncbi:MAG: ATP-binding protein [Bacteroidota bacterium]
MIGNSLQKGYPWLISGLLLLAVSTVLYLYDDSRSDEVLFEQVEQQIQRDFQLAIQQATNLPFSASERSNNPYQICQLLYSPAGRLMGWNNNGFLPAERKIKYLRLIPAEPRVVKLDDYRTYYQIREKEGDSTTLTLIPLHITHKVSNDYLLPYFFLGRQFSSLSNSQELRYLKNIRFTPEGTEGEVVITDLLDDPAFSLSNLPIFPFRSILRYTVLVFLLLGTICLAIFLRIFTIVRWDLRYHIDIGLFFGVIAIRLLLHWISLPGDFLETKLFSPEILATDPTFAPSLGELTLNLITVLICTWILYTYLLRISNVYIKKILDKPILSWVLMAAGMAVCGYLLSLFIVGFERIVNDSTIDIEFSNLLQTNVFSYLILLDAGLLFLLLSLLCFIILKLNVFYGRRYGFSSPFLLGQFVMALGINLTLFYFLDMGISTSILVTIGIMLLGLTIYRIPFEHFLKHDLANYLIFLLLMTIFTTYGVTSGIALKNKLKAERISNSILGGEVTNTIVNYQFTIGSLEADLSVVQETREQLKDDSRFRDWVRSNYVEPNFQEFNVDLFLYDEQNRPLDTKNRDREPFFGPEAGIPIADQGIKIDDNLELYQLPNRDNRYRDLYIGSFILPVGLDTSQAVQFLFELTPAARETEGLYSSLSLDKATYDDIALLDNFDHALYRDGILYHEEGVYPFPIELARKEDGERLGPNREYFEIQHQISGNKVALVRYPVLSFLDVVTTFSFVFYFFAIAGLILFVLPVFVIQSLRARRSINLQFPLRARIRLGLLGISIIPMIIILVLLYPFIQNRFEREARAELSDEAARMVSLLGPEYQNLIADNFTNTALNGTFRKRVKDLEDVMKDDVNVFDRDGRRVASTQPLTYEQGLTTDLMNSSAYFALKNGGVSDLVVNERIGSLRYLSAYRPIIGADSRPVGFINIPFIAQQNQLNSQVIDFLAYLANIYLLVFLLINLISVAVAGTITQPLAVIRQRLSAIRLGNVNERINYNSKDEIGEIVSAYNEMVEQLEESEEKITQTERELAWRQMARQVAHEIKNPLTPMKLSIQHLSRTFKEQTPRFQDMFPKVMKTLLVQIDSMANIANSFSEFARMPEPINTRIKINDILLEVVDLYTQSQETIWLIDITEEAFWSIGDRDQLGRCFNNIIKNALQAIESNGILHISMRIEEQIAKIEIKDNGKGIPEEIQPKIFQPSFSTKNSGMGLGLAIVRRIIENTGGEIYFESVEGKGTTFFINLPAADAVLNQNLELEKVSA